jgi:hypothetical protein
MNSFRWLLTAVWCATLAVACAKSKEPEAGTNTNWLKRCDITQDCQGAGSCLCGVCTVSCADDTTCAALGGPASCTQLTTGMCPTSASGSACLPPDLPTPSADSGPPSPPVEDAGPSSSPADDSGPPSPPVEDAGFTLERVGANVRVSDRYRTCGVDDDCVLVSTSCNACCDQDAIGTGDRDAYRTNFERACSGYQGAICDCEPLDLVPICQDGSCRALPRDAARDCYSPTQNVTRAHDPGAVGCACGQAGLQICVGGVALICTKGTSGPTWTTVEDGPCALATDCRMVQQRNDETACLSEFATCVQLPTGAFCGHDCHAALDCAVIDCEYTSFGGDCSAATVYEGLSGDVRYRFLGGIGSTTWYWNASSGQLLAMVATSDVGDYCGGGDNVLRSGDLDVISDCQIVMDATTQICP